MITTITIIPPTPNIGSQKSFIDWITPSQFMFLGIINPPYSTFNAVFTFSGSSFTCTSSQDLTPLVTITSNFK